VSADGGHSCAIAVDGTLACWGDNYHGEATPPAGTFSAVSAGGDHSCAVAVDGTLACWGVNDDGQATPPAGTFTAVSAGSNHACAIAVDGTLACWGLNEQGQATPPPGTYTAVSAGRSHTCAIRTDGTLVVWGDEWMTVLRPEATVDPLAQWRSTTTVHLQWSARPVLLPVVPFDVLVERWPWDGGSAPAGIWRSATTATSATFIGSPGFTYCFRVRARDAAGVLSEWSPVMNCTGIPLDDRSLSRKGWVAGTGTSYYRGTYLRSYTRGAALTLPGVVARRIVLIATTCSTCGTVRVYLGSALLKSVSLYSPTTVHRAIVPVVALSKWRVGTLTIRVSSSGKRVVIDGVGISRRL